MLLWQLWLRSVGRAEAPASQQQIAETNVIPDSKSTPVKVETTMQQGTADVVDSKCILRPYRGFSDFGLVPFADAPLVTDSSISLQSDDCLNQNPEPYLFQQFHVASRPPFLWGSFCMHPALNHFASYSVGSFFLRRETGPQH